MTQNHCGKSGSCEGVVMGKGLQYMTSPSGAMKGSSIHVAGWGTFGAWTWETVLKWDPQDKQVGLQLGYITFAIVFVNMFPFISIYAWCICVYIYTYICIVSLDYIILDLVWFDMLYIYAPYTHHLIYLITMNKSGHLLGEFSGDRLCWPAITRPGWWIFGWI